MTEVKITSLNITNYTHQNRPSGSFHVQWPGGSMNLNVSPETAEAIWDLLAKDFNRHRQELATGIEALRMEPLALTGPVIDDEELPF